MDNDDRYTRITLRIPKALHAHLAQVADDTSKSMNAEIIARLEETQEIEEALVTVAPGAPVIGTAGLLLDMAEQLRERHDARDELAASLASNEIKLTLSRLETLPLLAAALALQIAHPDAVTDRQRERLTVAIARMIGSDSSDPAELLSALSGRLIEHALATDLGL